VKTSRNDPCPCGSGEKYKKCCLGKSNVVPSDDVSYRRISKVYRDLEEKIEIYIVQNFNEEDIVDALDEFFCRPEEDDAYFLDEEIMDALQDLYRPWLIYNYRHAPGPGKEKSKSREGITIAEAYMRENLHTMSETEKNLVMAISRKPYSFFEVTGVSPGESIDLENILTGESICVKEYMGSKSLQPKHLVFARTVTVEGIHMLIGMGRTILPHGTKPRLIELRKSIRGRKSSVTDPDLTEWDSDLRQVYFDIDRHLRMPPQMQNTDGDPLEFHKLVFEITDPQTAFEKLASLCTVESAETLRETAKTYKTGMIREIGFSWTKKGNKKIPHYDNTILGNIHIQKNRLTIEVNSARRAGRIRKEVESRLKGQVRFKLDSIEDMEAVMKKLPGESSSHKKAMKEHEALMKNPEIQDQFKRMILKHWKDWLDMKLPALGNTTPRKAARTKDGREAILAMLYDMETRDTPDPLLNELNRQGIQSVKKELGLE